MSNVERAVETLVFERRCRKCRVRLRRADGDLCAHCDPDVDTESSASRQHFIDTGDWLPAGRRWRFVVVADFPRDVTRDQVGSVLGDAVVMVGEPILERGDDGNDEEGTSRIVGSSVTESGDAGSLEELLASLPAGHAERPGLLRAAEFLRTLP